MMIYPLKPEPVLGRHPLPSIEQARQMFESKGVSDNSIVVAYDANFSAFSSRLWWLARYAGLNNVRVLNGGLQAWAECEFSMSSENIKFDRGMIRNTASTMRVTSLTDVEKVADGRSNSILIDARDSIRYSGQKEPLDKKAGHVPHAVNLPFTNNMDDEGRFLATDLLKDRFCKISNKTGTGENIIHMCGSGVTACHNILAMEIAGITGSSLYPGSWSGWIDDEKHTIATV